MCMKPFGPTLERMVSTCSLPVALEAMGERWSFMILLASFNGLTHFEEFQSRLGIARNILANRLQRLTDRGILSREGCAEDRRRINYTLTEKGRALLPTLIALRQWGERWELGSPSTPVLVDTRDGYPVEQLAVRAHDGRVLTGDDLAWRANDDSLSPVGGRVEARRSAASLHS